MLTPPTRIKHGVPFNDNTHPTPRRFSLSIKWWISKTFVGFQIEQPPNEELWEKNQLHCQTKMFRPQHQGRVGMKKSDNLDPRTGKSRTTIKEPKLLTSHQPNRKHKRSRDRNHSSIVVKKKTDFILPTPPETSQ
ncbi:hypothetical protein F2Q68_00029396 [Brassica cretica]|uniref:Uncharacterized protein n=1 Tax=Brassica cretica TaxID=69181 RepID=A0A8S9GCX8_BRACR|nr:hypothetical protein F2Q68_00029396 [Brassica cretica]